MTRPSDEAAGLREIHTPNVGQTHCSMCRGDWPCRTIRLAADRDALAAKAERSGRELIDATNRIEVLQFQLSDAQDEWARHEGRASELAAEVARLSENTWGPYGDAATELNRRAQENESLAAEVERLKGQLNAARMDGEVNFDAATGRYRLQAERWEERYDRLLVQAAAIEEDRDRLAVLVATPEPPTEGGVMRRSTSLRPTASW